MAWSSDKRKIKQDHINQPLLFVFFGLFIYRPYISQAKYIYKNWVAVYFILRITCLYPFVTKLLISSIWVQVAKSFSVSVEFSYQWVDILLAKINKKYTVLIFCPLRQLRKWKCPSYILIGMVFRVVWNFNVMWNKLENFNLSKLYSNNMFCRRIRLSWGLI